MKSCRLRSAHDTLLKLGFSEEQRGAFYLMLGIVMHLGNGSPGWRNETADPTTLSR